MSGLGIRTTAMSFYERWSSPSRNTAREDALPTLSSLTGDIAHSGKAQEYELAAKFFEDLLAATGLK